MRIGITGKMCSGKTYVSNYLSQTYNLSKFSFASKVKNLASELFDMKGKDRKLIQTLADKIKDIDKDVWVKCTLKQIGNKENVVIDDLRFENELKYLRENDFIIIRLNVNGDDQALRLSRKYPESYMSHLERKSHNSERDIDNLSVDYEVYSDSNVLKNIDMYLYKIHLMTGLNYLK